MICSDCGELKSWENKELKLCAGCNKKRRIEANRDLWPDVRRMVLAHAVKHEWMCKVCGAPISTEDDVHHMMGRVGYADEEARANAIPLLLDVRYLLPVHRPCHQYIELHPEAAKKNGWSLSRLEKR